MTSDFIVSNAAGHFAASKSLKYREQLKLRYRTFVDFLQGNGLTTHELLAKDSQVTADFKIFKSDLTDEGYELMRLAYDRWLGAQDRGKPVTDVTLLEKTLAKIRESV